MTQITSVASSNGAMSWPSMAASIDLTCYAENGCTSLRGTAGGSTNAATSRRTRPCFSARARATWSTVRVNATVDGDTRTERRASMAWTCSGASSARGMRPISGSRILKAGDKVGELAGQLRLCLGLKQPPRNVRSWKVSKKYQRQQAKRPVFTKPYADRATNEIAALLVDAGLAQTQVNESDAYFALPDRGWSGSCSRHDGDR